MARIISTNNYEKYKNAFNSNKISGLSDCSEFIYLDTFTVAFNKRVVKTDNFLKIDENNFIASSGTIIYKQEFGKNALKKIFDDFDSNHIDEVRSNGMGNYLIVIQKNDCIYAFVDKYQIFKTYYFNINDTWFISNSLFDIGKALDDIEIDEFAFMQETMQIGVIGNQSIFKNVYQLFGDEFIQINHETQKFSIHKVPYKRTKRNFEDKNIDEIVEEFKLISQKYFGMVKNIFGNEIGIHMTGGLDSRTILSGFLSVNAKPKLLYGIGENNITNTKAEDLNIIELISNLFNLEYNTLNWENNYLYSFEKWNVFFAKYGFNYSIYGVNNNFFEEYEGKLEDYPCFFEFGYFGEYLRLRDWAQKQNKNFFTIDEFVSDYHLKSFLERIYVNVNDFKKYLIDKFKSEAIKYEIQLSENMFSVNQFEELRLLSNKYADSRITNFINEFAPSVIILSTEELYEFILDVPAKYRKDAVFQLKLIDSLCSKSLDIPFFSHAKKQCFDKKEYKIKPLLTKPEKINEILKHFGISGQIYSFLRKLYFYFSGDEKFKKRTIEDKQLKKLLIESISIDSKYVPNFILAEKFDGDIRFLLNYALYIHAIRLIRENN